MFFIFSERDRCFVILVRGTDVFLFLVKGTDVFLF